MRIGRAFYPSKAQQSWNQALWMRQPQKHQVLWPVWVEQGEAHQEEVLWGVGEGAQGHQHHSLRAVPLHLFSTIFFFFCHLWNKIKFKINSNAVPLCSWKRRHVLRTHL